MSIEVEAITFDDFRTLRYTTGEKEDIIYPILRALKREGLEFREKDFLEEYSRVDASYREMKSKTLRERLLDDMIAEVLKSLSQIPKNDEIIKKAVNKGLATRKTQWYAGSKHILSILKEKGYNLGLISNTHWRLLDDLRREFKIYFEVITLSYEHGYVKPHPSIFLATLERLNVSPDRCIHVGDDTEADIKGAAKCGIKTAFIKRGDKLVDSDLQISQLTDLLKFL